MVQVRNVIPYAVASQMSSGTIQHSLGCLHKSRPNRRKKNKGRVQKKHMSLFFEAHASLWRDPGCRRGSTFDSREYMSFILNHDHGMEENKFFFPLVFFARVKILRG